MLLSEKASQNSTAGDLMEWPDLVKIATEALNNHSTDPKYLNRLDAEVTEIVKQGANEYWLENYKNKVKWDDNPNGLLLPWLLGMTLVNPIDDQFIYIEDEKGISNEMIIITLENGDVVEVPGVLEVLMSDGTKKLASQLKSGDDLCF